MNDFKNTFFSDSRVDFVLTPTTPTTAFKAVEKKDPLAMYLSDIYTPPPPHSNEAHRSQLSAISYELSAMTYQLLAIS